MSDAAERTAADRPRRRSLRDRLIAFAASRSFQRFAARTPGLRRIARAEGEAIFDIVAGFVHSQILAALVELRVFHMLSDGARDVPALAVRCGLPPERMAILLQGGAALGLLRRERDGGYGLSLRGASFLGVPGLESMVRHHRAFYADLADPVSLLRGEAPTQLAQFWPYVFGAAGAADPAVTETYSDLMADSQVLVAEDTLRRVDLSASHRLLDVGGGTGAFLAAVAEAYPHLALDLFDLPVVLGGARQRLSRRVDSGLTLHPGSFRDDPLPVGADVISLIRVLYDHADATVTELLRKVHGALPENGRLVISEPMSGGARPDRATDTYFALYTAAMMTGRTRAPGEITDLLSKTGFREIRVLPCDRPFITQVITARR